MGGMGGMGMGMGDPMGMADPMGMGMGMGMGGPGFMGMGGPAMPGFAGSFMPGQQGAGSLGPHDPYAQVQSKYAVPSDAAVAKQEAARKAKQSAGKKKPVDRFEEGKRDAARVAAMAKRWG